MDYCKSMKKRKSLVNTITVDSKYVHLRLATSESHYIGLNFNFTQDNITNEMKTSSSSFVDRADGSNNSSLFVKKESVKNVCFDF